jgi:hypothetical protein
LEFGREFSTEKPNQIHGDLSDKLFHLKANHATHVAKEVGDPDPEQEA